MTLIINTPDSAEHVDEETHLLDDPSVYDLNDSLESHPFNFPPWYKWTAVVLVSFSSILNVFATIAIISAVPEILGEFHNPNPLCSILVVSIWELGEGIGPFYVAPLSELYGRLPVYHIGNGLAILCLLASAASTNLSTLVALRFLSGLTTTSLTLGPCIMGDLFVREERGRVMAVARLLKMMGPFGAPVVGSYVAEAWGWRWVIGGIAIAVGGLQVVALCVLRESYVPVLAKREGKVLGKNGVGDFHGEMKAGTTGRRLLSLLRPVRMCFLSPMLFVVSFQIATTYGSEYLLLTTIAPVFRELYGLSLGEVGWAFMGRPAGSVLGIIFYGMASDRYLKYKLERDGVVEPENRLLGMIVGAFILPIGYLVYGWTLTCSTQWTTPLIGTAIIGFGTVLIRLPVQNYVVDAFGDYAASATAVNIVAEALAGTFVPLAGPPLYSGLGYGWGNGVLGLCAAAFIPATIAAFTYGHLIRGDPRRWSD